jgi:pimeloyl-ACP methyl ester carboxylesterase
MTGAVSALQRLHLARSGFRTVAFSYPSIRLGIDEIASRLSRFVAGLNDVPVHFVGHSLGGLVILNMLALYPEVAAGRIVLLGTPCMGSFSARHIAKSATGRAVIGRALLDWQPERGLAVARRNDVGMIAGTVRFGVGRFLVPLPQPNDGVVALEETRMSGLKDHLALPLSHSGMLVSSRASRQVAHFLEHGHFARS